MHYQESGRPVLPCNSSTSDTCILKFHGKYYNYVLYVTTAHTLAPVTVVDKLEFKHLKLISEEVGRDWKMLGRHLGLDEATLESIQQAYFTDLKEAAYQMLHK